MIRSFRHKGLNRYYMQGNASGLPGAYLARLNRMLDALDATIAVPELDVPGWHLHRLKGSEKHRHSLRVSANWRLTFEFVDGDAHLIDLEDYH